VEIPIEIVEATRNVSHLTKLVKAEMPNNLNTVDPSHLAVYHHGIPWDALKDSNPLDPSGSVPGGTTKAQPLIVIAPSLPMRPESDGEFNFCFVPPVFDTKIVP
jgi:hypothetical protein